MSEGPGGARRRLPLPGWLRTYEGPWLRHDLLAGAALAGLIVPQGMAYAGIAGVEPQVGLYAAAAGLLAYSLFGSSRHLVVSPTSSSAAMLAAAVAPLAGPDPARYAALASGVAMGVGILFLLGRLLRFGFVSDFIAKPVLKGFMFGLALTIIVKQAPKVLGISGAKGGFFPQLSSLVGSLGEISYPTLAVGLGALAVILLVKRFLHGVPPALVALVLGLIAVPLFHLQEHGVALIGSVPTGLPMPRLPGVMGDDPEVLWAAALGIVLVAYVESLSAGRTLAAKHGHEVDPNRELLALGAANLASGLFQGIAVGGGLSGSAAGEAAGSRTPLATIVTSGLVVLTLLFLMPLFANLPDAVLAAIVIDAVRGLVDVKELRRYVRLKSGTIPHLVALFGVLLLGVLPGMLLAITVTLVILMKTLSRPVVRTLGRIADTDTYVPMDRFPEARAVPGLTLLRPEGPVFFANASVIRDRVRAAARAEPRPEQVMLNLDGTPVTGVAMADALAELARELAASGVRLSLCNVRGEIREFLLRSGALAVLGAENVHEGQRSGVRAFEERRDPPELRYGASANPDVLHP